ncbi:S24 family peptidase [Shinella zoogloeoides]|uniref:S24 family peptidase n=1 Tax=Shinella zoogloeoides TaxID=352475 RepID=UPI00273FFCCA|nr:helix-turn-helix transcriptional regulator [Shinella zoogloeoides]WLR90920.1 helix-turn-helix transcriptional regulator [Shinella zoogloeoides]
MFSHNRIWAAIDALAARHGLSPSGLARRAGLDPTAFNRSKRQGADGRSRWPSTESISKLLEVTGDTIEDFFQVARKTPEQTGIIPLIGFAQAGVGGFFDDGGFPAGEGWDVVEFPASPSRSGVYALEVQGDSMEPVYRDGNVIIVEPGAQVRRGDRVVVKTRQGEFMVKVLNRQSPKAIELLSLNPEHPNRALDMAEVEWVARVIWASQ